MNKGKVRSDSVTRQYSPTRRIRCCPAWVDQDLRRVVGLDGVDVDLFPGEILSVIGDNGVASRR
jgi:hypothetical protein